jgi:hypothetical protein
MPDSAPNPPLKALHPDSSLNFGKLSAMDRLSTESLLASLLPGAPNCLKTRADGTILEDTTVSTFCGKGAWMWTISRETS